MTVDPVPADQSPIDRPAAQFQPPLRIDADKESPATHRAACDLDDARTVLADVHLSV